MRLTIEFHRVSARIMTENYERGIFKLLLFSLILPPFFAVAPFGPFGIFLGLFIAYQHMITLVLPIAFTTMLAGYFIEWVVIKKSRYPVERDYVFAVVGYLSGFVAGLQLVAYQIVFGPTPIPRLGSLIGLATAGLLTAFVISRIGSRSKVQEILVVAAVRPTGVLTRWSITRGGYFHLRRIIILGLILVTVLNIALPLFLYQ
jgi:hypothetical protein